MSTSFSSRVRALYTPRRALFGLVAVIYLIAFPYHPGLRSPNELCRLWQTRSLVEYGKLEINRVLADRADGYGPVGDLSVMHVPGQRWRYYPSKAPLLSFAAVPVYAVLRVLGGGTPHAVPATTLVFWARFFLTILPTLGMLVLLHRFLRAYLSERVTDGLVVTYALGSLAFSYSLLFMSHQPSAVLLFLGFYALWRVGRGDWRERGWLVAGFFAAAAVTAEYTAGLCFLGLALFAGFTVGKNPKRLAKAYGFCALGALVPALLLMAYHQHCFGAPFDTGYHHLANPHYQPWHLGGFLGIRTPDPRAFVLSFFSPLRGLFTLAPFLLMGLPGIWLLFREGRASHQTRALAWFTLLLLLGYTYFTSSFSYESWGWTTGPRHLTGLVPFLLLPVGLCLEAMRRRAGGLRGLGAGLCVASIFITSALTCVNYIPDDVSSPLYALAFPLFAKGDLPPTALSFLGIPNPYAGGLWMALIAVAAIWAGVLLLGGEGVAVRSRKVLAPLAAGCSVLALLLVLLFVAYRSDTHDLGALHLLNQVWLTPPGKLLHFWPPS